MASNRETRELWIVSDGRRGHLNQSLGLAEALERICPSRHHVIDLEPRSSVISRLLIAGKLAEKLPSPDLIIGAGHRTHGPLLCLARRYKAPSVVLMKPSLPKRLFDLCLIPEHDLASARALASNNLITTEGALNRVVAASHLAKTHHLVLIGGPTGAVPWSIDSLLEELSVWLGARAPVLPVLISSSPRTPDEMERLLEGLAEDMSIHAKRADIESETGRAMSEVSFIPFEQTTSDWLPQQLQQAHSVWITPDSMSMVYEAMTSGAAVGVFSRGEVKRGNRLLRSVERLMESGQVTAFEDWQTHRELKVVGKPLAEAERCAKLVFDRFLK